MIKICGRCGKKLTVLKNGLVVRLESDLDGELRSADLHGCKCGTVLLIVTESYDASAVNREPDVVERDGCLEYDPKLYRGWGTYYPGWDMLTLLGRRGPS